MRYEAYLQKLAETYIEEGIADVSGYPELELYADQLITLLNENLAVYGDGKSGPITPSMLSNYIKKSMLPKPNGKKYSKEHAVFMTIIFYLRDIFSMEEIARLMAPVLDNYYSHLDEKLDLVAIYEELASLVKENDSDPTARISEYIRQVKKTIAGREEEGDDCSELIMLITMLVMQSNAQRFMARKLLEEFFAEPQKGARRKK